MNNQERLKQNLEKWAHANPAAVKELKDLECKTVHFCDAENGDLNLVKEHNGSKNYLHSQANPHQEAEQWAKTIELNSIDTLFVFGVGLGYYYNELRGWLKENANRAVVFVENDPEVLVRLFETVQGEQMLKDPQVWIYYFTDFKKEAHHFDEIAKMFNSHRFKITSLGYYLRTKARELMHFNTILSFTLNIRHMSDREYLSLGDVFYSNYYVNMFRLPDAYQAKQFYGKFSGVPAIICGAGPSLEKNIGLLKTLKDRAVIFAGGTAMNALNAQGMQPHFGVGVDPNADQVMRISSNEAYQVPYFYRNRLNANALTLIQGDHLYINGSVGYPIGTWFDEKLHIDGPELPDGYNVINLSFSLARQLGCNPIICVGVDLAYTDGQSYAPGISNHPINERRRQMRTKTSKEELVGKEDIHGNPVLTLWKWIAEAVWYSKMVVEHQDVQLINATEGGIGFPGIPNMTLEEVKEEYLTGAYDLETMIHGETQLSHMPAGVTLEEIERLMWEVYEDLGRCEDLCGSIIKEFEKTAHEIMAGKEAPPALLSDAVKQLIVQLDDCEAYHAVLSTFNDFFLSKSVKELQRLEMDRDFLEESEIQIRKSKLNSSRYESLRRIAYRNRGLIKYFLEEMLPRRKVAMTARSHGEPQKYLQQDAVYSLENNHLIIRDPHCGIQIEENVPDLCKSTICYENGKVKCENHFLNEKLHGPQTFFDDEGNVLSRCWYLQGEKQGRALRYYRSGALYSIETYCDGVLEGTQRYFFGEGGLRTLITYKKGRYDGEVILYYRNGQKKRELHYTNGVKHGFERMWNEEGQLKIEVEYDNGQAKGACRLWFDNGTLGKEVIYDPPGHVAGAFFWDKEGKEIPIHEVIKDDFFDSVTKETANLTAIIKNVIDQVNNVAPMLNENKKVEISKEINLLLEDLEALRKVGDELLYESGVTEENPQEAIWKTPQMRMRLEQKVKTMTTQIASSINNIRDALQETVERYIEATDKKSSH
ncbi:MAG: motility associated factor glycosyltransferase family protein [Chlamydiales bacterium]|nr:motility associated factor glycosyltransferase family protein [Chlamydiia bacterium]MCP5506986.1 motility associated factor glycosyltransferase family protein [Chlamydiales bacterium]